VTTERWLGLYCVLVVLVAMAGGCLPLWCRPGHRRLQLYLSFSGGVLIGAATFHMLGPAIELCGSELLFGWAFSLGLVVPFLLDRFVAPHAHEFNDSIDSNHDPRPFSATECKTVHDGHVPTSAHPFVGGWATVVGITIHTFLNGLALAGAAYADSKAISWPGLPIFCAIVLHKPADALAVGVVLLKRGVSRMHVLAVQLVFTMMVPAGCLVFALTMTDSLNESSLTGVVVALSAGMFLYVALADLLPEVQFHHHHRLELSFVLLLAVSLMAFITQLERFAAPDRHGPHPKSSHQRTSPITEIGGPVLPGMKTDR